MAKKGRRVLVTLTADLEMRLTLWAYLRDEKLPTWMRNVLRLRVNENWSKIEEELQERADSMGISKKELKEKILVSAGFDMNSLIDELENPEDDSSDE